MTQKISVRSLADLKDLIFSYVILKTTKLKTKTFEDFRRTAPLCTKQTHIMKTIIITGSSTGLGKATANSFRDKDGT